MIYLAFVLFVGDVVLLYHLKRERERHELTKRTLRWWRKYGS
jgi:putative copper export protein